MVEPAHEEDLLPLFLQTLEVVGHRPFPKLVDRTPRHVLLRFQKGLTIGKVTDLLDGIWVGQRGPVKGVTFRVAVDEMDGDLIGQGEPDGLNLSVRGFE